MSGSAMNAGQERDRRPENKTTHETGWVAGQERLPQVICHGELLGPSPICAYIEVLLARRHCCGPRLPKCLCCCENMGGVLSGTVLFQAGIAQYSTTARFRYWMIVEQLLPVVAVGSAVPGTWENARLSGRDKKFDTRVSYGLTKESFIDSSKKKKRMVG